MLIDRHAPVNLAALVPPCLLEFEPVLRELDGLLDDDALVQRVRGDLARRYPRTSTRGRPSTPVEVILRMLIVRRLYDWSYAETERFVADSLVLRQFCRVYLARVPDDTTLLRWAACIGGETLEALNARAVELARSLKITRGRKLRVDSTVVPTTIAHPTDSRLLGDGVRVLSRVLRRAKRVLAAHVPLPPHVFRSRSRSVRRLAQQIHRLARRKGEAAAAAMSAASVTLLDVAKATRRQTERVASALKCLMGAASQAARPLVQAAERFLPVVGQAIDQARRRVLQGERVPAREKLVSLFEPHTQLHVRQKAGKAVEFGRKVLLDDVKGGIVTRGHLLPTPGTEHAHLEASLAAHQHHVGRAPDLLAGDRGLSAARNERLAHDAGVRRVVLPRTGRVSAARRQVERSAWFRRGFRCRAGIEGRIGVLKRRYGLARCREHGDVGMQRWVGWGILTHNLAKIAGTVATRTA